MQIVQFKDLGKIPYKEAWDYQESILKQNLDLKSAAREQEKKGTIIEDTGTQHTLLLCEHPPVYTLGKSGHPENILISPIERENKGIEYYPTNRGGDITFHGPGQIVGYPILDLEKYYTDIGKYLRNLEEVIIIALSSYGVLAERSPGETGVWIDASIKGKERKICAMGVRCSRWMTMHGFALNVNTDLQYFNYIIPCGIANKQVTSLYAEIGYEPDINEVKTRIKSAFEQVFDASIVNI